MLQCSQKKKKRENKSQAEWNAREGCRKPPWGRADASWGMSTGFRSQGTAFKASKSVDGSEQVLFSFQQSHQVTANLDLG